MHVIFCNSSEDICCDLVLVTCSPVDIGSEVKQKTGQKNHIRARFRSWDLWVMGPPRFRCTTLMFLFGVQMQACYCFLEAHGRLTPCRQRLLEQGSCVSLVPHTSLAENEIGSLIWPGPQQDRQKQSRALFSCKIQNSKIITSNENLICIEY